MTFRAPQDSELVPKRQVLKDEILARFEDRSECVRESGDDLEHRAQSGRDHCGRSTIPWVDGVLARDRATILFVRMVRPPGKGPDMIVE